MGVRNLETRGGVASSSHCFSFQRKGWDLGCVELERCDLGDGVRLVFGCARCVATTEGSR